MKDYNILYVDDEQANLNSLKSLFRRKFNIITATSGLQGLELLEKHSIQLIIADQRMPLMTGIEFLKKVKEKWPKIRFILLTGYHDNQVVKEAVNEVGIYWYMNKPFENEKLELVITKALESFESEDLLKKSEEKFKGVFNSMIDVFVRRDLEHKGVLVSPSIYEITGYLVEDIEGKDISKFFVDPDRPEWIKQHLLKNNGIQTIEFEMYKKDGSIITISSNARVYHDNESNPLGIESIFRNITKQKQAELEVLQYQKHLKELATELTLTEEKVRKQIAHDLHDDVGQLLTSSRMTLSTLNCDLDKIEHHKKIKIISKALLLATQATRDAIFNLSPPLLHEMGLYSAIHDWMKEQIELKFGIKTTILGNKEIYALDENSRILIFRSVRELMINTVKHAKASHLDIELDRKKDFLEIIVKDDGVGFDIESNRFRFKSKSYGLFSIQERITDLGGSVKIISNHGFGTKIKLLIPLNK